jgi:hypothetical protein
MIISKIIEQYRILRNLTVNYDYHIQIVSNQNYLGEIFEGYGSDKGGTSSSQNFTWARHNYSQIYELFLKNKKLSINNVFECGIGTGNLNLKSNMGSNARSGASLRAWRDYFPNATIFGGDIDTTILFSEDRIKTFYLDQTSPESIFYFFNNIKNINFDLMVDDGLHEYYAGITLFENSIQYLNKSGIYVIEDVTYEDIHKYRSYFKSKSYETSFILDYKNFLQFPKQDFRHLIVIRE